MPNIKFVKYNGIRFKCVRNREIGTRMFMNFFDNARKEHTGKEIEGHIILDSTINLQESIVLTFWRTKEEMDKFYSFKNTALANLVESAMPLFEGMPKRADYAVSETSFRKSKSCQ
jgi:hypothetical protein